MCLYRNCYTCWNSLCLYGNSESQSHLTLNPLSFCRFVVIPRIVLEFPVSARLTNFKGITVSLEDPMATSFRKAPSRPLPYVSRLLLLQFFLICSDRRQYPDLDKSAGRVQILDGDLYYSPNCSRNIQLQLVVNCKSRKFVNCV